MPTSNPTNLANGDVVTETWVDAVSQHVVRVFTSTAARDAELTAPHVGQVVYLASNDANEGLWVWSSSGKWQRPWNSAWGLVTSVLKTSSQTSISSLTDITSLTTGPLTAVANRNWLVEIELRGSQVSSGSSAEVYLTDGSNNVIRRRAITLAANDIGLWRLSAVVPTSAGSVTFKGRATTGAGTFTVDCSSEYPAEIRVTDLGPVPGTVG